jgi:carbamoyl-phosphate synthase large subunit
LWFSSAATDCHKSLPTISRKNGVKILGTCADSVDAAEDRERFDKILESCCIPRPAGHTVMSTEEAVVAANDLGVSVLLAPPTCWAART